MLKKFIHNLQQIIPDYTNKSFLLTVSGGVDSMVMVELFRQAKLNFSVAHCNFQLRDDASFLDEELVQGITTSSKTKFHLQRFETSKMANDTNSSIQITARNLRYDWFEKLRKEENYDFIVTGHHANDNLETAIYKLAKGTGIKGIRGILPLQNHILRPLLNFTKKELVDFALTNEINWREDSSNKNTKYRRNFIRKEIIPLLEELNPQVVSNFTQSAERFRLTEQLLKEKVIFLKEKLLIKEQKGVFSIPKESFNNHQITPPLLFELLEEFQFSYSTCTSICENINQTSGAIYKSKSEFELLNDREKLILSKPNKAIINTKIPIKIGQYNIGEKVLTLSKTPLNSDFEFDKNLAIAYFDSDELSGEFEIRNWELGDKISPFGMNGKQKISAILINQKVPVHLKKNELVLVYKGQIIWLIGRRASKLFPPKKTILKIQLTEKT